MHRCPIVRRFHVVRLRNAIADEVAQVRRPVPRRIAVEPTVQVRAVREGLERLPDIRFVRAPLSVRRRIAPDAGHQLGYEIRRPLQQRYGEQSRRGFCRPMLPRGPLLEVDHLMATSGTSALGSRNISTPAITPWSVAVPPEFKPPITK